MNQAQGALMVAIVAMKASVDLLTILALKGLISPSEVDAFADELTAHLRRPESHPDHEQFEGLYSHAEHTMAGPLALAKEAARANWKGA